MLIDAYDSNSTLIYHYKSTSPEYIVMEFESPSVAYITIDDSDSTAFILNNISIVFGKTPIVEDTIREDFIISTNPSNDEINISCKHLILSCVQR